MCTGQSLLISDTMSHSLVSGAVLASKIHPMTGGPGTFACGSSTLRVLPGQVASPQSIRGTPVTVVRASSGILCCGIQHRAEIFPHCGHLLLLCHTPESRWLRQPNLKTLILLPSQRCQISGLYTCAGKSEILKSPKQGTS